MISADWVAIFFLLGGALGLLLGAALVIWLNNKEDPHA